MSSCARVLYCCREAATVLFGRWCSRFLVYCVLCIVSDESGAPPRAMSSCARVLVFCIVAAKRQLYCSVYCGRGPKCTSS